MFSASSARQAAIVGFLCAFMVLAWQFLTVRYNYRGDWSALFCTGSQAPISPIVAREHPYIFPNVLGWDGELYHAVAHDPLIQRGVAPYLDIARLRYRRILIPAMAYLLAGGQDSRVDNAYRAVTLFFFALGAWWLARIMQANGKPALWGLLFFLLPAAIATMYREAVDVGLMCFCAGFFLYTRYIRNPRALYIVLVLTPLVRETGLLLFAAYFFWLLIERDFRRCAIYATAAIPTIAWYIFVAGRTPSIPLDTLALPLSGVVNRIVDFAVHPGSNWVEELFRWADLLAVAGVLFGILLSFRFLWRRQPDPADLAIVLFALLGIFVWQPDNWLQTIDFARILCPLLLFEALSYLQEPFLPKILPLAVVLPRFGMEMSPQVLGIVRGLFDGA